MNTETKEEGAFAEEAETGSAGAAVDAEPTAGAAEAEVVEAAADPADRIAALEDEKMRIAAEFANYQKRINRDRAKWTQEAVRDLVAGMLPVLDNLEHAIKSFEGELKDPTVYRQGVELVQGELLRVLKTYQLVPVAAEEGTPFDPDQHQAISLVPADDVDEEVVAAVARTGYVLGETVLRPAQVVIKKPSA